MFLIKAATSITGGMSITLITLIIICISTLLQYKVVNNNFKQILLSPYILMILLLFINFIFLDLILYKVFFLNGEYHNYGLIGAYIWLGIVLVPLILSSVLLSAKNYLRK
jgi:heme exporter protein D